MNRLEAWILQIIYKYKEGIKIIRRIYALISSILFILSVMPVSAAAEDMDAKSLTPNVSAMKVTREISSRSDSSFTEWFIGLFGYYRINNEARLREAAQKNYAHEYTLKKDLTLSDTVKVTGTLNLKGEKTIKCSKTCFDICGNGSFTSKDITVISENGEAIINRASCTLYSGTYKSNADNAYAVKCVGESATVIKGGTFFNPKNTGLYIDGSGTNVFWDGGEADEVCIKPDGAFYMTGGHIGTISNEGKFSFEGGIFDLVIEQSEETAEPQAEIAEPKEEAAKPQEEKAEPVKEAAKPIEEKAKPAEEVAKPQKEKFEIASEADLKKAAEKGGEWTLTSDFTVSTQTDIKCANLKIIGKGHTITVKDGKAGAAIFNVISKNKLHLSSLNLKNSSGVCVTVNAYAELIAGDGEKCSLESAGNTVVNSGFTQLSYGTTLKTTGKDTTALKNNTASTAELYNCNVNKIENSGVLILRQSNSVVGNVININTVSAAGCRVTYVANREGAVWSMSGGYIETFSNHGRLARKGGTIKDLRDNYFIYPTKVMNITQNYNEGYTHEKHSHSSDNIVDYSIDDGCEDYGRSYFYCPCDEMRIVRIYGVGNTGVNTIWLQSTSKVYFADGTRDYVTIMVIHPNDDTLKHLKEGQTFRRKEPIFLEGNDGDSKKVTGYHFHISVGKGVPTNGGWVRNASGCWVLTTSHGTRKPEDAFFIDKEFTKVKSSGGLKTKELPD